jgi:hypothetical protein
MPDETSDEGPPWTVGRGEGFVAAVAARYGPEAGAGAAAHQRRGETLGALAEVVEADRRLARDFAVAAECDGTAARVRAIAERNGAEWAEAEECADLVADAEELAERIRRRAQDGLDGDA